MGMPWGVICGQTIRSKSLLLITWILWKILIWDSQIGSVNDCVNWRCVIKRHSWTKNPQWLMWIFFHKWRFTIFPFTCGLLHGIPPVCVTDRAYFIGMMNLKTRQEWPKDYVYQLPKSFREAYQTDVIRIRTRFDRIDKIYNPSAESKSRVSKNLIWAIGFIAFGLKIRL